MCVSTCMRGALVMALALVAGACTNLFFQPSNHPPWTPADASLSYRDLSLVSLDGVPLHGWFIPGQAAPAEASRPAQGCTIVHAHGNGGHVGAHLPFVLWMAQQGVHVVMFDYRGYGRSGGTLDLAGAHNDTAAVLQAVLADAPLDPVIDPDRVVLFGQSLGGAIGLVTVAKLPERSRLRAVAVEGAFSDYRDIAREKLSESWLTAWLRGPLGLTITDRFKPLDAVGALAGAPVLIIHGDADRVAPVHHGERLFEAAQPPKAFWSPEGGRHVAAFADAGMRQRFMSWLDDVCA